MGKGWGHLPSPSPPGNVEKCFLLQILSKISVDELCMHHFEKMSSASGGFAPRPPPGSYPWTLLGDFHSSDPLIAHPWKKFCGRPCVCVGGGVWSPNENVWSLRWKYRQFGRLEADLLLSAADRHTKYGYVSYNMGTHDCAFTGFCILAKPH